MGISSRSCIEQQSALLGLKEFLFTTSWQLKIGTAYGGYAEGLDVYRFSRWLSECKRLPLLDSFSHLSAKWGQVCSRKPLANIRLRKNSSVLFGSRLTFMCEKIGEIRNHWNSLSGRMMLASSFKLDTLKSHRCINLPAYAGGAYAWRLIFGCDWHSFSPQIKDIGAVV